MARGVGEGAIIRERRLFYKVPSKGRGEAIFRGRRLIEGRLLFGKWPFFCLKLPNLYCVVPKISIPPSPPTPTEGTFFYTTRGCLTYPLPQPLEFPKFSNLAGYPLERYFRQKCRCKILYAKDNCFCDKEGKNIFSYVNTVSDDLNFAL